MQTNPPPAFAPASGFGPAFDPALSGWRRHQLDGFIEHAGPLWSKSEEGGRLLGLLTGAQHVNPAGLVHGGLLATLMDHALSATAWEATGRLPCVTVQLDTQFIAAVQPGSFLVASSTITRQTASLIFMRGILTVETRVVATGSAILKVVRKA